VAAVAIGASWWILLTINTALVGITYDKR